MAEEKPPVDPDKLAVALKYERGVDPAPFLAAKGRGQIAEKIIELAKANGIEIREDEDLAVMLSKLDIDMPIPMEAYVAVAEILSYIYRANASLKHKHAEA